MSNPRIPYQMATDRPPIAPPDGKPLIVHLVVNVENWLFDNAMPRKILTAPHVLGPLAETDRGAGGFGSTGRK